MRAQLWRKHNRVRWYTPANDVDGLSGLRELLLQLNQRTFDESRGFHAIADVS